MAAWMIPAALGVASFLGNERTNSANAAMAQQQMDFQERMANTSYQRAVSDLNAAGLNPALAYGQGGAATPAGSTATMTNSAESGSRSFVASALLAEQKRNLQAQTLKTDADTRLSESQTKLTDMKVLTEAGVPPLLAAQTEAALSSASASRAMAAKVSAEIPLVEANIKKVTQEISNLEAQLLKTKQDTSTSFALDHLYRKQAVLTETLNGLNLVRTTLTGEQVSLVRETTRTTKLRGDILTPDANAAMSPVGTAAGYLRQGTGWIPGIRITNVKRGK